MNTEVRHEGVYLKFTYDVQGDGPALPLRFSGSYATMGWDTPNYWTIDQKGQAWQDVGGHGGGLKRCTLEEMLEAMDPEATDLRDDIRRTLGMKPVLPEWMKTAFSAGWTPPPGFDRSLYE